MRVATLVLPLALCAFAPTPTASAQAQFDFITFDRMELDPTAALGMSTRWGLLVNTGTVPISLEHDWEDGLWYGESTDLLGGFFWELLNPFENDFVLQPGEAAGDVDPLLLAELLPGETVTWAPGLLIGHLQFSAPFPATDFAMDLFAQVGDQLVKTRTDVVYADLGGEFWNPVSAKRWSSAPSPATYSKYGAGCPVGPGGAASLKPLGSNQGQGPPYTAFLSNMPQVGNWAFGVQIKSPWANQNYLVGIDTAPGAIPFGQCEILLGLTPSLITLSGQMSFFQETQAVPIPDQAALIGLPVYLQAVLLNPLLPMTNGIALTLVDVTP